MSKYTHQCIKPVCNNTYTDDDPDAYYCESCKKQNEAFYAEIEKKVQSRKSRKREASFEDKMSLFHTVRGITMINLPKNGNN